MRSWRSFIMQSHLVPRFMIRKLKLSEKTLWIHLQIIQTRSKVFFRQVWSHVIIIGKSNSAGSKMKRHESRDLLGRLIKELDQKFYVVTPLDTSRHLVTPRARVPWKILWRSILKTVCHMDITVFLTHNSQGQLFLQGTFGVWTDVKVLWIESDEGKAGI